MHACGLGARPPCRRRRCTRPCSFIPDPSFPTAYWLSAPRPACSCRHRSMPACRLAFPHLHLHTCTRCTHIMPDIQRLSGEVQLPSGSLSSGRPEGPPIQRVNHVQTLYLAEVWSTHPHPIHAPPPSPTLHRLHPLLPPSNLPCFLPPPACPLRCRPGPGRVTPLWSPICPSTRKVSACCACLALPCLPLPLPASLASRLAMFHPGGDGLPPRAARLDLRATDCVERPRGEQGCGSASCRMAARGLGPGLAPPAATSTIPTCQCA